MTESQPYLNPRFAKNPEDFYYYFDPFVLAIWGPPRSGKTSFAEFLAKVTNIRVLDIDITRYLLFDKRNHVLDKENEARELSAAYKALYLLASDSLIIDQTPVAIINTGSTDLHRVNAQNFAQEHQVPFQSIVIRTDHSELETRAEQPKIEGDFSNISTSVDVRANIARMQPFSSDIVSISGQIPHEVQVRQLLTYFEENTSGNRPNIFAQIPTIKR